jgi:hypothetical protein
MDSNSRNDRLASACSGMSNMIDELTSTVNRLNEQTHDRAEVEKNIEQIQSLFRRVETSFQGAKKHFTDYQDAIRSK